MCRSFKKTKKASDENLNEKSVVDLKSLFSNIVQNLDISRYSNDETLVRNTNNATLKVILKHRNHPSNIAIQNKCKDKGNFNFIEVDQKQNEK